MAAKLIDLSFTLNGRKVKVQIAPDTMLFALLREPGLRVGALRLRDHQLRPVHGVARRRSGAELLGSRSPRRGPHHHHA